MTSIRVETIKVDDGLHQWSRLRPRSYCRQSAIGIGEPCSPVDVPRRAILLGDARERLKGLPSDSVDCAVTSPPYYMLRDYGNTGQIGLESSVDEWVEHLRLVFAELRRVLKPAGSLWLNLGDSFSRHTRYGAPPKSLVCAPERLLLALAADGWIVRNKVIWAKPNPLPSSVADRLNLTYEVIYLLVRSPQYFFDLDAIREPHRSHSARRVGTPVDKKPEWAGPLAGKQDGLRRARPADQPGHELGKNPGDVWTIPTRGFKGPHFATFPPQLLRRPILATCPEAVCTRCGTPWKRRITVHRNSAGHLEREVGDLVSCNCHAATVPGLVLDPFVGAGTVGLVAEELGRDWLGIEINRHFRALALRRIAENRK
jgi:site-specific DNA-methyltransferase (adenine-specific)